MDFDGPQHSQTPHERTRKVCKDGEVWIQPTSVDGIKLHFGSFFLGLKVHEVKQMRVVSRAYLAAFDWPSLLLAYLSLLLPANC